MTKRDTQAAEYAAETHNLDAGPAAGCSGFAEQEGYTERAPVATGFPHPEPDWKAMYQRAIQEATLALSGKAAAEAVASRLRLTDQEREALANGIYLCEATAGEANENINANAWAQVAARLRGLLERTK
jgi:hypothetical protein